MLLALRQADLVCTKQPALIILVRADDEGFLTHHFRAGKEGVRPVFGAVDDQHSLPLRATLFSRPKHKTSSPPMIVLDYRGASLA
jgi:hypothetical protein